MAIPFILETLTAVCPFYLVSMPGKVKYPTRGGGVKCVTGHGLHIQPGQLWLHDTDQ